MWWGAATCYWCTHTHFLSFFGAHLLLSTTPTLWWWFGKLIFGQNPVGYSPLPPPPHVPRTLYNRVVEAFFFFWVWESCLKLGQLSLFVSFVDMPPPHICTFPNRCCWSVCIYITYRKGHREDHFIHLSRHPFFYLSGHPSVLSWSVYSDGAEKEWGRGACLFVCVCVYIYIYVRGKGLWPWLRSH